MSYKFLIGRVSFFLLMFMLCVFPVCGSMSYMIFQMFLGNIMFIKVCAKKQFEENKNIKLIT